VEATDGHPPLQGAGDPGVLGTARTLFPSKGIPGLPALGNLHLLPYGIQEGEAFIGSPLGAPVLDAIRTASTVAFSAISVISTETPQRTPPSVVAATTGSPVTRGATLHVATDLPARVTIELGDDPSFRHPRRLRTVRTGAYDALAQTVSGLRPGRRTYWRARAERHGVSTTGPVRSFTPLPAAGRRSPVARTRVAIAACACQFGPIFDHLAAADPDVLVWQGDLNYPDTVGPFAQTFTGYAGIWRDFLANPRLRPIIDDAFFATQRDDHDYAVQDANSTTLKPWGLAPWDALMNGRLYHRFTAGPAEIWMLDQRRFKSDPALPDGPGKTLLGDRQRRWLLRTLATSKAPIKVICSPCTVFMRFNARDGNWSAGFTAERDALLAQIDRTVGGKVLFVTGDTHLTGIYDRDGRYEARAAPLDIPVPNDVTLSDPFAGHKLRQAPGVAYADERGHVALLDITAAGLTLSLLREDGTTPYTRRFPLG
jgi:hypothetical protein